MEIILNNTYDLKTAIDNLEQALTLLHKKYKIAGFSALHLELRLQDSTGAEVELVDSDTGVYYNTFVVCEYKDLNTKQKAKVKSRLRLIVNNL